MDGIKLNLIAFGYLDIYRVIENCQSTYNYVNYNYRPAKMKILAE